MVVALALSSPVLSGDLALGMSAAFTGRSRGLGIELFRGASACFAEVNARGGVGGRRLVIVPLDDGYNPLPAVENTIALIDRHDVFALFGYVGTPTCTRVLPLLQRNRARSTLLFFPFTGARAMRAPPYGSSVFNLRASYAQETAGLVRHFVATGRRRIAVFYQVDSYGRDGWNGVRTALAREHLEIAAEATYRRGAAFTESMAIQVDMLRRGDAEAVISVGSYEACAAFIRDARDAGWNVPIANVSFVGAESLLDLLRSIARPDRSYTNDLINSQVVPACDSDLPAVRAYRAAMARHDPRPPPVADLEAYRSPPLGSVSLEGFLDARLLVALLEGMGPPFERARLASAWEALGSLDIGLDVPLVFRGADHQGSDRVYFTTVRDGRFVELSDWSAWKR